MGDLALGLSGKSDTGHCHPVEDVMGLDDRIEAKRLEAMPEIVVEGRADLSTNAGSVPWGIDELPMGLYAAEVSVTPLGNHRGSVSVGFGSTGTTSRYYGCTQYLSEGSSELSILGGHGIVVNTAGSAGVTRKRFGLLWAPHNMACGTQVVLTIGTYGQTAFSGMVIDYKLALRRLI